MEKIYSLLFWSKPSHDVWGRGWSILKLVCDKLKKTRALKLCAKGGNPRRMAPLFSKFLKLGSLV